jgi:hypothetical protein
VIPLAIGGVLFAAGAWLVLDMEMGPEATSGARTPAPVGDASEPTAIAGPETGDRATDRSRISRTDYRFPESGRLRIDSGMLTSGRQVTFGLALSDEELGGESLDARVIAVEGRAIDAVAVPLEGEAAGAGLALDADWLTPGTYLIQIRTKARTPLPLRRFVLEVD